MRDAARASRRLADEGPPLVLKAASILEEEIAMGIGAVKRIEQRFLDVDALRAQNPDHVMARFRRDAHEAVDIIVDLVAAAAVAVTERAGRVVNVTASRMASMAGPPPSAHSGGAELALPVVHAPDTVAPGASTEVTIALENSGSRALAEFTLHCSELIESAGRRIPAHAVAFDPVTLSLGPRELGHVRARVTVPADAAAGRYEALLRAAQFDRPLAILSIRVV